MHLVDKKYRILNEQMFHTLKSKRLPNFGAYISYLITNPPFKPNVAGVAGSCIGASLGTLLALWGSVTLYEKLGFSFPMAMGAFFGGCGLLAILCGVANRWILKPKTASERHAKRVTDVAKVYFISIQRRKIHKELDPIAAQLLETSAFYWLKIQQLLSGSFWGSSDLSAHYHAIKEQTIQATDQAMHEALILCVDCLGEPQRKRSAELRDALEDMFSLDIQDALSGLKQVARADSSEYAHRSPQAQVIFEPVREIATRLQELSIEIERISSDVIMQSQDPAQKNATAPIDLVLSELKALQQAEQELEEHQKLQGN